MKANEGTHSFPEGLGLHIGVLPVLPVTFPIICSSLWCSRSFFYGILKWVCQSRSWKAQVCLYAMASNAVAQMQFGVCTPARNLSTC
jgi:hypothetical protein